jgi:hypothetical protein
MDISVDVVEGSSRTPTMIRQVLPGTGNEVIRIAPVEWSTPAGDVVAERLTGIGGSVIERKLMQQVIRP